MSGRLIELGMHFDPAGGGADRYFAGLTQGLAANGVPFAAAAFGTPGRPAAFPQVSLGEADATWRHRARAIRAFGRREIPPGSMVATHFSLYALPLLSRLRQCAHIVHFHGPWAAESASEGQNPLVVAAKRWIEKRAYRSARRLIVLSPAFRDILVNQYQADSRRVKIIPGGVDLDRFRPSPSPLESRFRLGWPPDKKIIFCVRRLVHRMGLEHLLDAFALIASDHPDALLVIAGKGPLSTELRQWSWKLGLEGRVRFAGFVADDLLPDAYSAADFSIVPSQALEGFGLITVESLACGTPVIVTPVGGLPESVRGLDPSLVMAGCRKEDIAEGMRRGLQNPLPARSACREHAERNFSWPGVAAQCLAVYEEAACDSVR